MWRRERVSSGLLPSWRWIIKKSKLLSWLFRFIVQLLRRCEVFLSGIHVAIYPPSLSPKQHTSNRHASCCHWEQAYKANHVLSRNKVQLHTAFVVIPLFYHFPQPNNIQQNELIVIGVWGRVKKPNKQKDTDGRDTILLQKQVNAEPSLACQALCEACTAS